ncbi:uncharacterized protein LOC135110175 isoform X1 [Scylla paramamosain]|uniref:uncharacterized protein LOC135110175 isoform X1 n=1 Tax=Scylla paramamosain TaxID=85552 RepID=UPI003083BEE9
MGATTPLVIVCVVLVSAVVGERRLSPAIQALADEYFSWRMKDMPEFASFVGIHDYDDQLDDMSLSAYQNRFEKSQIFFQRAVDLRMNTSTHEDELNLKILESELLTFIDGFPYYGFLAPLTFSEGVHVDLKRLISWMVFETTDDYEKLLSRYSKLPQQLSQIQMLMEEGVRQGIVNHAISMKGVSQNLGRYVVETAEESPLWEALIDFPEEFTEEQISQLQERGRIIITQQVSPAFQQLREFIDTKYTTRPEISVTSLPDGEARYNQLVRFHTSTSTPVPEIHQLGLEEVDRIEAEMAKIVAELGYNMSVPEFSSMIRNDSRFYYDDPDSLIEGFRNLVYDVINPRISDIFNNIPDAKLSVVPDPSPDGAGAFYLAGSYDGSRPGIFYVNTYHYDAQPKYSMMTLSLHEGNPGHHLQTSHSIESPNMPFFRRVTEDRNYCHSPSRFPINTAFGEGWGLYAESLGFDMNLFEDPYDRYGHYSDEIFRACRLVVDTGMHALGWTRKEAVEYMFRHTALARVEVENEIDRYITWPGQALAYKIGDLKIEELKAKARDILGLDFDIKEFHQVVLEAAGPLDLLEEEVNDWVTGKLG